MFAARPPMARMFALGNALIATLLSLGWLRIGATSWLLDAAAGLFVALLLASAFGLLKATPWRLLALRLCAWTGLCTGLCALALIALAVAAGYVSATDADLSSSRTLPTLLGTALLLPYLILYPSVQLLWAHHHPQLAERP